MTPWKCSCAQPIATSEALLCGPQLTARVLVFQAELARSVCHGEELQLGSRRGFMHISTRGEWSATLTGVSTREHEGSSVH